MKVTLKEGYRNKVLGLDIKKFRELKKGKTTEITQADFSKCPNAYIEIKNLREEVKDGNL